MTPGRQSRPIHPYHEWQMDVSHFRTPLGDGANTTKLLVCVDMYSTFIYPVPIKSEKEDEIARAFAEIMKISRPPKIIRSDNASTLLGNAKIRLEIV